MFLESDAGRLASLEKDSYREPDPATNFGNPPAQSLEYVFRTKYDIAVELTFNSGVYLFESPTIPMLLWGWS